MVSFPPLIPFINCLNVSNWMLYWFPVPFILCTSHSVGPKIVFLISKDKLLSVKFVSYIVTNNIISLTPRRQQSLNYSFNLKLTLLANEHHQHESLWYSNLPVTFRNNLTQDIIPRTHYPPPYRVLIRAHHLRRVQQYLSILFIYFNCFS